jgi:hypothetical protein
VGVVNGMLYFKGEDVNDTQIGDTPPEYIAPITRDMAGE